MLILYQLHFGREILEGISNAISCNKTMHGTAATGKFNPPLKNVIYTLGVKSISKLCFSRCMRSTEKRVSYGAWEAQFLFLQHLRSETNSFFFGKNTTEGCQKWQNMIPTLHEKQKTICFLRSMRSIIFIFATPLD